MLAIISNLITLNQLTTIMQDFATIIATFIFGGPSNLSQESTTRVNTIATHEQNRL